MKKNILTIVLAVVGFSLFAQVPSTEIKDIENRPFNTDNIANDGKPIIIDFWATWCKPCVKELEAIAEVYADWQEETGVKLYAVSIDNSRSMSKVAPFVNGKGWEYEVLIDPNGDLKRAMNVINVPHVFLLDGNKKIVYQHTTYAEGDEEALFELIKKVAKGESIEKH